MSGTLHSTVPTTTPNSWGEEIDEGWFHDPPFLRIYQEEEQEAFYWGDDTSYWQMRRFFQALLGYHEERHITLQASLDPTQALGKTEEEVVAYLQAVGTKEKAKFLSIIAFLLSRPDIISPLLTLAVTHQWKNFAIAYNIFSDTQFTAASYSGVQEILAMAPNLTTLKWSAFDLNLEVLLCIHRLRFLHTISFDDCTLIDAASMEDAAPVMTSIHHLLLGYQNYCSTSMALWDLLPCFPSLRTLFVSRFLTFADAEISSRATSIRTLRKIHLDMFVIDHFVPIWIGGGSLNLTHLKLRSGIGMSRFLITQLLTALRIANCTLQVLVLEGLLNTDDSDIEQIALTCPNLLGLTLFLRDNRQTENRPTIWPQSTAYYAASLSRFPRLQHFGWNALVIGAECSPNIMIPFEDGYTPEHEFSWEHLWGESISDGGDVSVARLFVAHCPTLRSYSPAEMRILKIERDAKIGISVWWDRSELGFLWNPGASFDQSWAAIDA
ncbi:hypothetical protein HWV62_12691 [Athelia sp. TMB]|nr:hypothetical protein HWV62_12691 [Athelia sp. TMB]